MNISIIVAVSNNHCIGKDNQLLWHLPTDMAFFKKITTGGTVLMGRNTYLSIPEKFRPLPQRKNIVISKNENFLKSINNLGNQNLAGVNTLEKAMRYAKDNNTKELFIIGGADVYRQAISYANKLYLTKVDCHIEGDAYFYFNESDWQLLEEMKVLKDEKNIYDCLFLTYQKKQND